MWRECGDAAIIELLRSWNNAIITEIKARPTLKSTQGMLRHAKSLMVLRDADASELLSPNKQQGAFESTYEDCR